MTKKCSNAIGIILSDKREFFRTRCKQWDCAYCIKENKLTWRKSILRQLRKPEYALSNWVLLTLTMPSAIHAHADKVYQSAQIVKNKWNNFMTAMRKRYGKFTYVRVLEHHASGVLHIHMLTNAPIPECDYYHNKRNKHDIRLAWLKANSAKNPKIQTIEQFGFGWSHNVVMFGNDAQFALNYATKYLTKNSADAIEHYPMLRKMRIRRIQTSRDIKAPKSLNDDTWRAKIALIEADFPTGDEAYKDLNKRKVIRKSDLEDGFYPPISEYVD